MAQKRGKKYTEAAKLVDRSRDYQPQEAIALVKQTSPTKFDATVETHLRLGIDPRHADQQVRGTVVLPAGTGRSVRVVVFPATGERPRRPEPTGSGPRTWRRTSRTAGWSSTSPSLPRTWPPSSGAWDASWAPVG